MNALHPPAGEELAAVWDDFAADPDLWVAILTGSGRMAAAGGVHRLPRSIPLKIAMGMLLTGKSINAAEAATLGLVNEVIPLADLMPAAERWARTICECSPLAVQATKQSAYDGL